MIFRNKILSLKILQNVGGMISKSLLWQVDIASPQKLKTSLKNFGLNFCNHQRVKSIRHFRCLVSTKKQKNCITLSSVPRLMSECGEQLMRNDNQSMIYGKAIQILKSQKHLTSSNHLFKAPSSGHKFHLKMLSNGMQFKESLSQWCLHS